MRTAVRHDRGTHDGNERSEWNVARLFYFIRDAETTQ